MSITYCDHCDIVLEGEEIITVDPTNGETDSVCPYCGQPTTEHSEDSQEEMR